MKHAASLVLLATLSFIGLISCTHPTAQPSAADKTWTEYQGGPHRNQYSSLQQINTSNVDQLEVAWQYHTGDTGEVQTNPIIVNDTLYGLTAALQPFALNAATGEEYWQKEGAVANKLNTSRGLVYWKNDGERRILYTNGPWLYALDARTGAPISSFGQLGRTSLKAGLGKSAQNKMVISTTPGTVYKNLIIMPLRVSESAGAAPGFIQAFDIKTGALEWVFHTIPKPGEFGHDTWPKEAYKNKTVGGANNWAGMAIDRKRGIVYAPTGSATYDFYGGKRIGKNLFANTLLALDAETGKRIWHYQLVHHDILDRDPPAPPNLVTLNRDGHPVDAVVQVTKQGFTFVFNRETGEPLFPIKERPVPSSDVPGEQAWPTQPFPVKPRPFARQTLIGKDLSPYAENRQELMKTFLRSRFEGPFTPLSRQGTIIFPGLDGGAEWGGAAVDPQGILYVNSNEMAWHIRLEPTASEEQLAQLPLGKRIYITNCSSCHGTNRQGSPASGYPSLVDIGNRQTRKQVKAIISGGKGMMPSFSQQLSEKEKQAVVDFLWGDIEQQAIQSSKEPIAPAGKPAIPYKISGYDKFLDENGLPAVSPPWGTLNAIDLNTGEFKWRVRLGTYPELTQKGIPKTGSESYGGPVVTAGGLLFIAGTKDKMFKAFDKSTGKLLWKAKLPAAGFATPSTYAVDGKQYIVIACGGTKLGASGGDSYVAFTLPD